MMSDELNPFPWNQAKEDLEQQGWAFLPEVLPNSFGDQLRDLLKIKLDSNDFSLARIGKGDLKNLDTDIRLSKTCWIEDWNSTGELKKLFMLFSTIQSELNSHFFLSMKHFESQFAYYPKGGYYKKHLDQFIGVKHRQVSLILYLNDCSEGGELVIYDRDDKMKINALIKPKAYDCVLFFSSQIYHEVLTTQNSRMSLTTWFRDDLPF